MEEDNTDNTNVNTTTENMQDKDTQVAQLIDIFTVMFSKQGIESDPYINSNIRQNRVPIEIIVQAPRVAEITSDVDTIKQALFECKSIEATEDGVIVKQEQLTLVLRNIPSATPSNDIIGIFQRLTVDGGKPCPTPQSIKSEMNDMWFVTFATKEDALVALSAIVKETFNDQPIKARLKTESITKSYHSAPPQFNPVMQEFPMQGGLMPPQMFFPGYQMAGGPMPNIIPPMMVGPGGVMPPMMGYPIVMGRRPMQWAPGTMPVHLQQQPQNQYMMRPGRGQNNANKNPRSPRGNVNGRGFQDAQQQYYYQGRGPTPRGWSNNFRQYQGYRGQDEAGNIILDEAGMTIPLDGSIPMNGGIGDDVATGGDLVENFVQDGMMMMDMHSLSHDDGDARNRRNKKNKKHGSADDGDLNDNPGNMDIRRGGRQPNDDNKDRNSRGRNDKGDKNRRDKNNKPIPAANFNVESDFPTLGGISPKAVSANTFTSGYAAAARMTVPPPTTSTTNTTVSDTAKNTTTNKKTNDGQKNVPSSSAAETKANTKNSNTGSVIGINAPDIPTITFGTFDKPIGLDDSKEKTNLPITSSNTKSNKEQDNDVANESSVKSNTAQENSKDQKNVKRSFLDVVVTSK